VPVAASYEQHSIRTSAADLASSRFCARPLSKSSRELCSHSMTCQPSKRRVLMKTSSHMSAGYTHITATATGQNYMPTPAGLAAAAPAATRQWAARCPTAPARGPPPAAAAGQAAPASTGRDAAKLRHSGSAKSAHATQSSTFESAESKMSSCSRHPLVIAKRLRLQQTSATTAAT
jgi:hypothetical protein